MFRVWLVSTKTWGDRVLVKEESCTYGRSKNQGTSKRAVFDLNDPQAAATVNLESTYPGQRAIVVEWGGHVIHVGIIWEADFNNDDYILDLTHDDIWSFWDMRLIAQDKTENITKWSSTLSGLSKSTLIKRMLQWGTNGTAYELPLTFPADAAGSNERKFYGYDMDTVQDLLSEMMTGGPDIDFRPYWTASKTIAWEVRIGDLTDNLWGVNFAVQRPGASGLSIKTSARQLATHQFAVGEGSEVDMLVRESQSANISEYPQLDRVINAKDIRSGAKLYESAAEELVSRNQTTRQASMNIHIDHRPAHRPDLPSAYDLADLKPGTQVRWYMRDNPYILTGWRIWEVVKFSGDTNSDWVSIDFQEKGG